ncbi:MAG: RNA polymerase sigma factor [Patescibacteria group bacterium]|jgi:RNA polymerase sigma-70 factor (ECF subfamily)
MSLNIIEKLKERNLKDRLRAKDQQAFEDLYNKNIDDIYRFIFFKIGKKDEASDLSSLVFLKTWEYLQKNKVGAKETLRALVYRIARNVIVDYYRERRPDTLSLDDENNPIDVVDEDYNIELSLEIKGDYQILLQKIMELKNEYREIIIMRFVNELSLDEISSLSGKKKINVRVLLHRALKALKELLMEDKIST